MQKSGKSLQQDDFRINEKNYKLDPDIKAAKVAYEFYKKSET
ncbi:MAG: hypothetical protein ACQEWW_19920 [Bacillota bacterium]